MAIVDPKNWTVDNQRTRGQKGRLIRVVKKNGAVVKMYEADAIAQGLIKGKPQAENKMRPMPDNKTAPEAPAVESIKPDDFASISGIGPATAKALVVHGITTFEQLHQAGRLDYLSEKVNDKIEDWRVASG